MLKTKKTVMVFGTFDELHDGHRFFLSEARKLGQVLIAVLPPDSIVEKLKGRTPRISLPDRVRNLRARGWADDVVTGDEVLGAWDAVRKYTPAVIALGYDQHRLRTALEAFRKEHNDYFVLKTVGYFDEDALLKRL